jgi:hypothetical protein
MGYFQLNGIPWQVEVLFISYAFEGLTFDAMLAGIGMNAPGVISSTRSKISCPFRGLSSPPQMHTQGELISSRE